MASDLCTYSVEEVERIVRVAARLAAERRGKLCSVDKANVLEATVQEIRDEDRARAAEEGFDLDLLLTVPAAQ